MTLFDLIGGQILINSDCFYGSDALIFDGKKINFEWWILTEVAPRLWTDESNILCLSDAYDARAAVYHVEKIKFWHFFRFLQ